MTTLVLERGETNPSCSKCGWRLPHDIGTVMSLLLWERLYCAECKTALDEVLYNRHKPERAECPCCKKTFELRPKQVFCGAECKNKSWGFVA